MKQNNLDKEFNVPFKGIVTNTGKAYPETGACTEIINLRPRGETGEWEVVGGKAEFGGIPYDSLTNICKHPITETLYFGYKPDSHTIHVFSELTSGLNPFLGLSSSEEFVSFSSFNNFFFVNTTNNVYSYIWCDNEYTLLPELKTPVITASETEYHVLCEGGDSLENSTLEGVIGMYYEHLSSRNKAGNYEGGFMMVAAYRLSDGTYIKHGHPSFCLLGAYHGDMITITDDYHKTTLRHDQFGDQNYFIESISTGKFKVEYEFESTTSYSNFKKYKDLIISLDFFMTPIISWYDIDKTKNNAGSYPFYGTVGFTANAKFFDNVFNTTTFYKVHSIKFEDVITYKGNIFIENDAISSMQSNLVLETDQGTNHSLIGTDSIIYNGSLIYNNTTTIIGDGYDMHTQANRLYLPYLQRMCYNLIQQPIVSHSTTRKYWAIVYLKTSEGDRKVIKQLNPYWFYIIDIVTFEDIFMMILPPVITYHDLRAYKIEFGVSNTLTGEIRQCNYYHFTDVSTEYLKYDGQASFKLTPSDFHNYSYFYFNEDTIFPSYIFIKDEEGGGYAISRDTNNTIHNPNHISASQVNNPLVFPAARTYALGDSSTEVITTAVAREALGQGQYGQFPLYAFTNQGIYALEVGSGDILFSRVFPMNSEALINKNTVIPVNNSIFFATKEGYKFITGNQVQNISIKIRSGYDNKLTDEVHYEDFIDSAKTNPKIPDMQSLLTSESFITYLESSVAVYDSFEDEIILSNINYNYSWVYNIKTQTWYKVSDVYGKVFYNYPGYLAVKNGETKIYDFSSEEDKEGDEIPIFIQTEPIRLTDGYYKINNLKLLCEIFLNEPSDKIFGFYVFGSVDNKEYKFLNGKQMSVDFVNGITFSRHALPASVRYVIFVITGEVYPDSRIKGLAGTFAPKYQNKIR
jgi:hypothetical protein